MKQALLVGLGGFIGTVARYLLGSFILHRMPNFRFPVGTFTINILGCFLIGLLAGLAEKRGAFSPDVRLFLFTGICGGFTTFSAFAHENVFLLRRDEPGTAITYIVASVLLGLLAVWIGFRSIPQT